MATLQRSAVSFRRQGSSGSVWEDKFSSGNMHNMMQKQGNADQRELRPCQSVVRPSRSTMAPSICPRSLSTPAGKPASHKAFGFGFLGVFRRPIPRQRHTSGNDAHQLWDIFSGHSLSSWPFRDQDQFSSCSSLLFFFHLKCVFLYYNCYLLTICFSISDLNS